MTTYYKVINPDGTTPQGYGRWPLPTKADDGTWAPGGWVTVKRRVKRPLTADDLCTDRVLHVLRADQIVRWLGPVIAEVEVDGEIIEGDDKCGVQRARLTRIVEAWNERTARIFAVECAESVIDNLPDDLRPTVEVALYVARCYADGEATDEDRSAAAAAAAAAAKSAWSAAAAAKSWSAASDRLIAALGIER